MILKFLTQLFSTQRQDFLSITCEDNDTLKIIRNLDISKAHGFDNISIRMVKLCHDSLVKPLSIIFQKCINSTVFPDSWKKSNTVPIQKKNDEQLINNYRPVSLLPICSKIFERIIFNSIFQFIEENKLLNVNHSGFNPSDSCKYQLLSIVHNIYAGFDQNPPLEVRSCFLDISKAFDKIWHEGLIYKMETMGFTGSILRLLQSFLSNRYQRVTINGQTSDWLPILAGVPQGSILGPFLFLIFINNLPDGLVSLAKLFAGDTFLFSKVYDSNFSARQLSNDLQKTTV